MEVQLVSGVPLAWLTCTPIRTYETTYLYTGLSRIDTYLKKIQTLESLPNGNIKFTERDFADGVVPRVYSVEHVRVTDFAHVPRVWKEEVSPTEVYFYCQCGPRRSQKT